MWSPNSFENLGKARILLALEPLAAASILNQLHPSHVVDQTQSAVCNRAAKPHSNGSQPHPKTTNHSSNADGPRSNVTFSTKTRSSADSTLHQTWSIVAKLEEQTGALRQPTCTQSGSRSNAFSCAQSSCETRENRSIGSPQTHKPQLDSLSTRYQPGSFANQTSHHQAVVNLLADL